MLHTLGEYVGAQYTLDGDLCIMFAIDADMPPEELESLKNTTLVIEAKKYRQGRSLNANAYFWKLCDEIAKKLGSDKDTVYLIELKSHGVFDYLEVIDEAVKSIKGLYRYVEEDYRYLIDNGREMVALKCYIGSSQYNSKQMADLIDGTVHDANDLGIDTWTREEIENLINNWKGRNNE